MTHPLGFGVYTNVGYTVRPERTQFGFTSDDRIRYGLGLTTPSGADGLRFYGTLTGELDTVGDGPQFGKGPGEAAEVLGGIQWTTKQGVTLNLGGGPGLTDGAGAPLYRVVAAFGFSPPDNDKDRDGIIDRLDMCPIEPEDVDGDRDNDGCPDDDRDGDQIKDDVDACPEIREDYDGFQDSDGCPEDDNDGDGIKDEVDRCPLVDGRGTKDGCPNGDADNDGIRDDVDRCPEVAEDKDGFDDDDGCPDEDNDFDGVLDKDDRCPFKAEDKDGFQDTDGCPDEDNDKDGIADVVDQCPDVAENMNGVDDEDGCPEEQAPKVKVSNGRLVTEKVYFGNNSDRIESRSFDVLNSVAKTINDNPQIRVVSIEGHTDGRGNADKNQALSQRRADAVMKYLIGQGVSPDRLRAQGFGPDRPIADNDTPEGREQNRRVEFIIK
ncbi:MAG: OmpA family protein [bacterium]